MWITQLHQANKSPGIEASTSLCQTCVYRRSNKRQYSTLVAACQSPLLARQPAKHCDARHRVWPPIPCQVSTKKPGLTLGLDRYRAGARYPILDTIGCSCTDTDTGNEVPHSLRQTYVTYVAHTVRTFQSITPLTLCFETFETNYWLKLQACMQQCWLLRQVNELLVSAPILK